MDPENREAVPQESWNRTRRSLQKAVSALGSASSEEDCQSIGLLCRETLVSLAQAVTQNADVRSADGLEPSPTDAKRMLDSFIAGAARGASSEEERAFARASISLASKVVHQRTATPREAALCLYATEATVRITALMAGVETAEPLIRVGFEAPGMPRLLQVTAVRSEDLPSLRYRRRVEDLLKRRRRGEQDPMFALYGTVAAMMGHGRPLESLTTEELEKVLATFDPGQWREDDEYERFEKKSLRLNVSLHNAGQQFLEDVLVRLAIPNVPGLSVSRRVPSKPFNHGAFLSGTHSRSLIDALGANQRYPNVAEEHDRWIVSSRVGDLRHKLTTPAFGEPVRISITEEAAGKAFVLTCTIHGRQLPDPIQADLILDVLPIGNVAPRA